MRLPKIIARPCGFLVLLVCACRSLARTWHVAQNEIPQIDADAQVRTISEATSRAEAGDTIVVHGGVYREFVRIDRSGTAETPITIRAAEGEYVVLTGADHLTKWVAVPGEDHVYVTDWPHRFITWTEHNTHPNDEFHRLIGYLNISLV